MAGFFAGLVDGVMAGKDWREGREDRARVRKMQDEEFTWAREDQGWQREDRQYTRSERQRAIKERDAERVAWEATADELYGPQDGNAPAAPAADAPAKPRDPARTSPQDMVTSEGGLGFSINDALTVSTKGQPEAEKPAAPAKAEPAKTDPTAKPAPTLGTVGASTGKPAPRPEQGPPLPPAPVEMTLADAIRSIGEDAVGYRQGQVDPLLAREAGIGLGQPAPDLPAQEPRRMVGPVAGRPEVAGSMPAAPRKMSIMDQMAERNMPQASRDALNRTEPQPPQAERLRPMVEQGRAPEARPTANAVLEENAQRTMPQESRDRLNERPVSNREAAAAYDFPPIPEGGPIPPPRAEDASLPAAPTGKPAPKQEAAAAVPETPAGTPMESLAALKMSSEELSFGIVGKDAPIKTTEARVQRATEQSAKAYERDHVPAIVEHYVRTGQLDKAKAFEQWIDDKGVKEGMKSWLGAIHSFQVGDGEGFLNKLADAYESANYYDDGLSIVRDQSELTYDDRGNIVGAQITFKDEATGEVFTQNVSDARDLVASAIGLMAPEKAFELAWDQTFGAKPADDATRMTASQAANAVNSEAEARALEGRPMTEEEKAQRYEALMTGQNPYAVGAPTGGSLGNVPVYR